MRKQTKVAAIVSAAALLVIGASMTSMASVKGTWMMVDGEWMCYDSNGDPYEDVFASSNGKDFYLGDDGYLVRSSWVEYDGDMYFVNSSGQKITNDWRLTVPYEDDENEEEWFYFQSTGKRAENKKITYKGNTYYFDSDGIMLTGWVSADGTSAVNEANDYDSTTYYCGEDGARLKNAWVYDVEPGTEDDDADADEYWYYIKSSGKPATGKQSNIKGQTYLFDENAHMLYGWVEAEKPESSNDFIYHQLTSRDEDEPGEEIGTYGGDVYYCGEEDDGHAKKNKWVKTFAPENEDGDDGKQKWYWFDKNGKLFRAGDVETPQNAIEYSFDEGQLYYDDDSPTITGVSSKKVNSKTYWFNKKGQMLSGFYMIEKTADTGDWELFYFGGGDDGSMKTGSQSIEDDSGDTYKFYFNTKTSVDDGYTKGSGVIGNKSNKLYYYGLLIQADDYKYQLAEVEGHKFVINTSGTIQHSSSSYKEDGDVIIEVDSALAKENKESDLLYDTTDAQWKYAINEKYINSLVGDVVISNFIKLP